MVATCMKWSGICGSAEDFREVCPKELPLKLKGTVAQDYIGQFGIE